MDRGEPGACRGALLVLGRQVAEFAEDHDRLDVLALDETGEIVIVELKVAEENFRVTDLQALAYAGAYASRDTNDLAETLRTNASEAESRRPPSSQPGVRPSMTTAQPSRTLQTETRARAGHHATVAVEQAKQQNCGVSWYRRLRGMGAQPARPDQAGRAEVSSSRTQDRQVVWAMSTTCPSRL